MAPVDQAMVVATLAVPPMLAFAMKKTWLGYLSGVAWVWGMMVAGGAYHLATDPQYDSIAPGLSVVFGWFFGAVYGAPWFGLALAVRAWQRRRPPEQRQGGA